MDTWTLSPSKLGLRNLKVMGFKSAVMTIQLFYATVIPFLAQNTELGCPKLFEP